MPERPTVYVDRCTGRGVANALKAAGARVEHHDDHLAQEAEDVAWIPAVAARGIVSWHFFRLPLAREQATAYDRYSLLRSTITTAYTISAPGSSRLIG
ncbi:MAG: hypothetical protein ACRC33_06435 [Gemmataceae bacterium]